MTGVVFNGSNIDEIENIVCNGVTINKQYFNGVLFWERDQVQQPEEPEYTDYTGNNWSLLSHSFMGISFLNNPPLLQCNVVSIPGTKTVVEAGLGWQDGFLGLNGQRQTVGRSTNGGSAWVERNWQNQSTGTGNSDNRWMIYAGQPFNAIICSNGYVSKDGSNWKYVSERINPINYGIYLSTAGGDTTDPSRYNNGGLYSGSFQYGLNKVFYFKSGSNKAILYNNLDYDSSRPTFNKEKEINISEPRGIISSGCSSYDNINDHIIAVGQSGKIYSINTNTQKEVGNSGTFNFSGNTYARAGVVSTPPNSGKPALVLKTYQQYVNTQLFDDYFIWDNQNKKLLNKIPILEDSTHTNFKVQYPGIYCNGPNIYVAVCEYTNTQTQRQIQGLAYSSDGLKWKIFEKLTINSNDLPGFNTKGSRFSFNEETRRLVYINYSTGITKNLGMTTVL